MAEAAHSNKVDLPADDLDARLQRELASLNQLSWALSQSLDIDEVLSLALETTLRVIGSRDGAIYLVCAPGGQGFELRAQLALTPDAVQFDPLIPDDDRQARQMIAAGGPLPVSWCKGPADGAQAARGGDGGPAAGEPDWVGCALTARDRLQGLMVVRRGELGAGESAMLRAIGQHVGLAIDNAQLYLRAQQDAHRLAEANENARMHHVLQEYAADLEMRVEARTAEVDQERERLLTVLESAGEGIAITDADGALEYANPAWERLTGQEVGQAIERQLRIVDEESFPDLFASRRSTSRYQHVWRRELAGRRPDGTGYTVDLTVTPIFTEAGDARQLTGLVAVYRDVTEYKELDRIKSEFMSTAAHELRGPLTSIMGFSELLLSRQGLSEDERGRFLHYINKHARHLKELIDDLLDISRIESGASFTLDLENIDIHLLLEQEVRIWQEANPGHTYELQAAGAGAVVRADVKRIQQVVRNLLSNATKYSPAGTRVTVGLTPVGKYMEMSVSDQGIGMTPAELSRLFEKFWRANASSTADGGTGLGLVIVKYIVEHHGGQVWVESQPGKGTLVHFTLLRAEHPTTVLIVEDEDSVREIEERILISGGLATLTASDGQQAIDAALAQRPDLVLLDLMMPGMSGLEVLGMLKSHPATAMIPVVVVSARSGWQIIEETHMLGAADFLAKPFEYEELLGRVRRALVAAAHPAQGRRPTFHP